MTQATQLPRVRTERLIVEDVLDEILVYDLDQNKAHSLNSTAAVVWRLCKRQATRAEAVEFLSQRLGPERGEAALDYGLVELEKALLLRDAVALGGAMSRRAVMRKIGLTAAVGLPIVTSLVAPAAVQSQSGGALI